MTDIEEVLRRRLTNEQYDAAVDPAGEVLCLACAGSGKSRTLAYRIARLLARGAEPKSIVAFTFTEKAADAIKLRVAQALGAAGMDAAMLGAIYVGTIHSYCQHVLCETDARYRQFEVLDENRLRLFIISRMRRLEITTRPNEYFKTINEIASAWKLINDEMLSLDAVLAEDPGLGNIMNRLSTLLDADEFIDFSLMIRLVVDALRREDRSAVRAVDGLRHLMVDEYQDVNPSQEALIQALHRRSETLFVVGDDDQSIYGWRGADVGNILTFAERYPGCSQHRLNCNFRSIPAIVTVAEGFASAELGPSRIEKEPRAEECDEPRDFRVLWFAGREEEAAWTAERIHSLLGTEYVENDGTVRGLTPGDFAVLMRSTREGESDGVPRHAAFTAALDALGIPYTLEAGGGVFDRPQVSVLRDTFELLRNSVLTRQVVFAHFETVLRPIYPHADLNGLIRVLTDWGRRIHTPPGGARRRIYPQQLVYDLLSAFGIERTGFGPDIMQDIGIFSRIIQDVEAVYLSVDSPQRFREILNFLQNEAELGYDTSTRDVLRRPDAVSVSTVHKAKGLEFPVVCVVDVESGRFPKRQRGYNGRLPRTLIEDALTRGAYQTTPDEEARLFYTAITRPERYLYVTGCENLPAGRRRRKRSPYMLRLNHPEISGETDGLPDGLRPCPAGRRIDETVVPTSYSDIRYYLRCPKDYQFRKMFGFSPPITEMFGFGKTVHAAVCKLHEIFTDRTPSADEAEEVARGVFHLQHIPPSGDPKNRPGGYERAMESAVRIARNYTNDYAEDFTRRRQVEARFEIPLDRAVISGSIDLLLKMDEAGNILDASVVDFKAVEGGPDPEGNEELSWSEMALQVQLYAKAADEILGENARTGAVHLLKDNQRVEVPVTQEATDAAVANVEWAVGRIIEDDFPMRPERRKCDECDFKQICQKIPQGFRAGDIPPQIHIPGVPGTVIAARAFSEFDGE